MTSVEDICSARSFLFVPGNRPERFAKAFAAGADVVIIDLEDAVAPADKHDARRNAGDWLSAGNTAMVRINAAGTPWHDADLELVAELRAATMVAKAEDPLALARIASLGTGLAVVALVETAAGIVSGPAICATPGVVRCAFGSIDFATQLGVDPNDQDALLFARSALVTASAAARSASPVDGVTTALRDRNALVADLAHAKRVGMTAKLCIHPSQIDAVHASAEPTSADLDWAQRVLDGASPGGSASAIDGQMIDAPVLERARRILASSQQHR